MADARHHLHVLGLTGTGKSTWLAGHALAEAAAGRGMVLIDCQGDLARHVITRLPAPAAGRVVLLDPDDTTAPPAWNVLAPDTNDRSHTAVTAGRAAAPAPIRPAPRRSAAGRPSGPRRTWSPSSAASAAASGDPAWTI